MRSRCDLITRSISQTVDAAIVDGAAHLTSLLLSLRAAGELNDERGKDWIDGGPWYQCYQTSDGHFVSVGALEAKFFYCLAGKLNSADQLYLVIETVKRDTKHAWSSNAHTHVDGAEGSTMF